MDAKTDLRGLTGVFRGAALRSMHRNCTVIRTLFSRLIPARIEELQGLTPPLSNKKGGMRKSESQKSEKRKNRMRG
jgi:hypothetical protein